MNAPVKFKLTDEQRDLLRKIDLVVKHKDVNPDYILYILKSGWYNDFDKNLLNEMRTQYIKTLKRKK